MDYIKIVVVDDSPVYIKATQKLLAKSCPDVQVVGAFTDPVKALEQLKGLQPDLLLLDIEMPGLTGFQFLSKCKYFTGGVIFITAFSHYAVQAFKFSAIDYLLKPVDEHELIKAVGKYKKAKSFRPTSDSIKELSNNMGFLAQSRLSKIALNTAEGIEIARTDDILFLKAEGNYTAIKRSEKKEILVSKTLKIFEGMLSSQQFVRLHNSYLINIEKIERYVRADGGFAIMIDGSEVPVSRRYRDAFLKQLKSM